MSKKLYLGWGKSMSGKYGDFWNLTIDLGKVSNNPHVIKEHKGKKYLNITMSKLSKPFEDGSDVRLSWNDFVPEKKEIQESSGADNVPF